MKPPTEPIYSWFDLILVIFVIFLGIFLITQLANGEEPKPFIRLMSAEKENDLKHLLPVTTVPEINKLFADPRLILYTNEEIPRVYQLWNNGLRGIHDPNYNISGGNQENAKGNGNGGNGSVDFPWKVPAGTELTTDVDTFKFIWLPIQKNKLPFPIVYWRGPMNTPNNRSGGGDNGYHWIFPVGAKVGEVLFKRFADGYDRTFEVRLRIRQQDGWAVEVFRPFENWEDLQKVIRVDLSKPDSNNLVFHTLKDNHPDLAAVNFKGSLEYLPKINAEKLLSNRVFKPVSGIPWRKIKNGSDVMAPIANKGDNNNIVPAMYTAGVIDINSKNCKQCHASTNKNVDFFDQKRDWYGQIPGSDDGIISFHPFDKSSISHNGSSKPVVLREVMFRAGIVANFDSNVHPSERYKIPK